MICPGKSTEDRERRGELGLHSPRPERYGHKAEGETGQTLNEASNDCLECNKKDGTVHMLYTSGRNLV